MHLLLLGLIACSDATTVDGCAWPTDPAVAEGVLANADTCGFWTVPVDEHLYVNVSLTAADADCSAAMDEAVALNSAPIYSNLTTDGPKWTFDVVGVAPVDPFASFDVSCDEGTRWAARVQVTE